MTVARHEDRPRMNRRQLLWAALIRPALGATTLVVLYFTVPMDQEISTAIVVQLIAGMVIVAGLVTWQTISISRSASPRLRAIQALASSLPLFLLLFATTYYLMANDAPESFSEPLTRMDSIYFTVTVFATVGFGDISARSQAARIVTTLQMLADLVLVGLVLRVILGAVRTGLQRQSSRSTPPPSDLPPED
jgi:voltage-gated potassium channel